MKTYYKQSPDGRVYDCNYPGAFADWPTVKPAEAKRIMQEQARADLLEFIQPGTKIHCTVRHVAKSGMSRVIAS